MQEKEERYGRHFNLLSGTEILGLNPRASLCGETHSDDRSCVDSIDNFPVIDSRASRVLPLL